MTILIGLRSIKTDRYAKGNMTVFNNDAMGALEFTATWEKDGISHEEQFLGRKFNPVNDIFPRGMREALEGKQAGESVTITYEPRMCIPRFKESLVRTIGMERLRKKTIYGKPIVPMVGRFYPQGHIDGLQDIYPSTLTPFRLIGLEAEKFIADCNHPLANQTVTIEARIQFLETRDTGTYGSLTHWREKTCDWGPGMQARHNGQATDFYDTEFFTRKDEGDTPFTPPPVDAKAMRNLQNTYDRFLAPGMRVLDFSHTTPTQIDGEYDAAICSLSIEYMADPIATLEVVKSHLKPSSPVLIGFTNHFDAHHVIQGWVDLHEFERMGLVMDYLHHAGLVTRAGTISIRNDWRPQDDPLFLATRGVSDPIYVVYGHKK